MAKLSIAIFFLLSTLSIARTPLNQQENDISDLKLPNSLSESNANPITLNQFDTEAHRVQDLPEPKAKKVKALPLTFVRLRPINRHFRVRSRHPFRLCDHHIHHAHNLKPRTHLDQIPYDKDMIHSSGENSDFENVVFHDRMPEIVDDWINFLHHNQHHHDDDDDDDDDDELKMSKFLINHDKVDKLKLKSQLYEPLDDEEDEDEDEDEDDNISAMQHEDHHSFDKKKLKKYFHHHDEEKEQEAEEKKEAPKEAKKPGSFIKRIRKFLDPYLD